MSAVCGSQAAVGPAPTHLSVTSGWSRRPHSTTCWPPGGEGPGWSAAAEGTSPWSLAPQLQTNPIQAWPSSGPIMSHPWDGGEGMRGGCTPGLNPVVCCATGHQPCGSDPASFITCFQPLGSCGEAVALLSSPMRSPPPAVL